MQGRASDSPNPPTVGIVGAGFAGLRCADVLLQHGCKVTIFEARNRLGGRVAQSRHLGHLVDLGPNWIHGTIDNRIYDIAKQTKTRVYDWEEQQAIFDTKGQSLDSEEASKYFQVLWSEEFVEDAYAYSKKHKDSIDPQRSLYEFLVEKSAQLFTDEAPHDAQRKRDTFLLTAQAWGAYVGSPVTQQSLKFFWMEECLDGETPFVASTYAAILEHVAKRAAAEADIKYNHEVTGVVSDAGRASNNGRSSITCSNGTTASFDAVVVTTPLGWLKKNPSMFEPSLPLELSQAIENIGCGSLDKVYITFPNAFWDEPVRQQAQQSNGLDSQQHHSASQQDSRKPPSVSIFLSPTYADTNLDQYYQECMHLSALPDDCAHPTLLFYIYGDCSKHIAHLVSSAEDKAKADASVLEFFRPYYSLLPNYDSDSEDCAPKAVLATTWASDKWAGYGSYSNFPIGTERADKDIETMAYGMPERGVYLAGEHTAPIVATGTATGAYLSGEIVAERILEAWAKRRPEEK